MLIQSAQFVVSNTEWQKCPEASIAEYAFIGRSNVGKSSLINMLTGVKDLAKVSSKPGKTKLINHFLINEKWFLTDLPGYGWAQLGKEERAKFEKMIADYMCYRPNLQCVFVLIDIRHELQVIDAEFMAWMGENQIPFVIVFTKADKLSASAVRLSVGKYQKAMLETWEEMPRFFITSSEKKVGRDEILNYIEELNWAYKALLDSEKKK
jgi:GTP-binding protein